jgi:UDPglucose 6-dehydrogenase
VIEGVQNHGAGVVAYGPVTMSEMRTRFPDVTYAESAAASLEELTVRSW